MDGSQEMSPIKVYQYTVNRRGAQCSSVLYNSDLSGVIVITILIIDAWVEKCSSDHCSHFRPLLFVLGPEGAHIVL